MTSRKIQKHYPYGNAHHIYEKDLAKVYPKLLEKESYWNESYNITGNEVLTAEEYLGFIAKCLGKELSIKYLSQSELDTISYIQPFEFNLISDTSKIKEKVGGTWDPIFFGHRHHFGIQPIMTIRYPTHIAACCRR